MNFMTHEFAVCVFPKDTLVERQSVLLDGSNPQMLREIYSHAGLSIADDQHRVEEGLRSVGDSQSWVVSFRRGLL